MEILTVQGAPVCHVAQAGIVVVVEIGALLRTESAATLMFVAAPVLESPPAVVMFVQSALVVEYVMPTLVVTYAHASLVVEYVTPTLTAAYVAPVTTRKAATTVFPTATMSCPLLWLWHAKPQLQRPW